jgi:hypothetical protein
MRKTFSSCKDALNSDHHFRREVCQRAKHSTGAGSEGQELYEAEIAEFDIALSVHQKIPRL